MDEAQAQARFVNLIEDVRWNYGSDAAESAARVAAATLHAITARPSDDPLAIPEFINPATMTPPGYPERKYRRKRFSRRFMVIQKERARQPTNKPDQDDIDLADVEA
jgi:hypothetical protein